MLEKLSSYETRIVNEFWWQEAMPENSTLWDKIESIELSGGVNLVNDVLQGGEVIGLLSQDKNVTVKAIMIIKFFIKLLFKSKAPQSMKLNECRRHTSKILRLMTSFLFGFWHSFVSNIILIGIEKQYENKLMVKTA